MPHFYGGGPLPLFLKILEKEKADGKPLKYKGNFRRSLKNLVKKLEKLISGKKISLEAKKTVDRRFGACHKGSSDEMRSILDREQVWTGSEEMSEMRQAYGVKYMRELERVFFCRYAGGIFLHRDAVLYVSDTLGM